MLQPRITVLSESVLLLQFGDSISQATHQLVMQAKQLLEATPFPGMLELVPAYHTLAVHYNPLTIIKHRSTIAETVVDLVTSILQHPVSEATAVNADKVISIPVCYHPAVGTDLAAVCTTLHIDIATLIQLHTAQVYTVYMLGFTPGFPYMGMLPPQLFVPRKSSPALQVAPGAVAIAGNQTGIYPLPTPGGWHVIGQTPLRLFDPHQPNPFLLKAGDKVRFDAIDYTTFQTWQNR